MALGLGFWDHLLRELRGLVGRGLGRKGWELKGAYDGFSLFQFRPTFSILYMVKFQINKEQSFDPQSFRTQELRLS